MVSVLNTVNTVLTRLTHRLSPGRTINLLTTLLTHRDVLTVLLTVWESRGVALRKALLLQHSVITRNTLLTLG